MTYVRHRFLFTLIANIARSSLGFCSGLLVARLMGPNSYGNMAFLLGTFVGVRQLLDMGTSAAFFTFLSQKARSRLFIIWYFTWMGIQFGATLLIVGALFPADWIRGIWQVESRLLVLCAFAAAFMQGSTWPIVQQAGEAQRRTALVQVCNVMIAVIHLIAVLILWKFGKLGLYTLFIATAVEHACVSLYVLRNLEYPQSATDGSEMGGITLVRKYAAYCLPLIPYSWLSFANEFCDRWLLQSYGGSVDQAYYAVSAQLSTVALIATTSVLRIFWKEVAEASFQQNHVRTEKLYTGISRLLFLIGALSAGFLIPYSKTVLYLLLGQQYEKGAATLAIMFLYPVHQSMGQICGTMLYATERIRLQVILGSCSMLVGLGLTYFALAPPFASVPGLGLGSEGLAVKMVLTQAVTVNVTSYLIARSFKWKFDWIFQPVALVGFLFLGCLARIVAEWMVKTRSAPIEISLGVAIYACLSAIYLWIFPWLTGLSRHELATEANRLRLKLAPLLFGNNAG